MQHRQSNKNKRKSFSAKSDNPYFMASVEDIVDELKKDRIHSMLGSNNKDK